MQFDSLLQPGKVEGKHTVQKGPSNNLRVCSSSVTELSSISPLSMCLDFFLPLFSSFCCLATSFCRSAYEGQEIEVCFVFFAAVLAIVWVVARACRKRWGVGAMSEDCKMRSRDSHDGRVMKSQQLPNASTSSPVPCPCCRKWILKDRARKHRHQWTYPTNNLCPRSCPNM